MKEIDKNNLPKSIAFIMDGNGRWAKKRLLPHSSGHKQGADTLKEIAQAASSIGILYMTVFAFSTENWNRPPDEVEYLMDLMDKFLTDNLKDAENNDYRIKIIGQKYRLRSNLQDKIKELEKKTEKKTGMTLNIAISYGGRDEIIRAVKEISSQVVKGAVHIDHIDENLFQRFLDTKETPDPDLIIRTSGENRLSNFLIWQSAYSEIHISNKLWPDFKKDDLLEAISDYQSRDRRFGKR